MANYIVTYRSESGYLEHHGILGQKWGIRRFQNEDGSLTAEGRERYYGAMRKAMKRGQVPEKDIDSFSWDAAKYALSNHPEVKKQMSDAIQTQKEANAALVNWYKTQRYETINSFAISGALYQMSMSGGSMSAFASQFSQMTSVGAGIDSADMVAYQLESFRQTDPKGYDELLSKMRTSLKHGREAAETFKTAFIQEHGDEFRKAGYITKEQRKELAEFSGVTAGTFAGIGMVGAIAASSAGAGFPIAVGSALGATMGGVTNYIMTKTDVVKNQKVMDAILMSANNYIVTGGIEFDAERFANDEKYSSRMTKKIREASERMVDRDIAEGNIRYYSSMMQGLAAAENENNKRVRKWRQDVGEAAKQCKDESMEILPKATSYTKGDAQINMWAYVQYAVKATGLSNKDYDDMTSADWKKLDNTIYQCQQKGMTVGEAIKKAGIAGTEVKTDNGTMYLSKLE